MTTDPKITRLSNAIAEALAAFADLTAGGDAEAAPAPQTQTRKRRSASDAGTSDQADAAAGSASDAGTGTEAGTSGTGANTTAADTGPTTDELFATAKAHVVKVSATLGRPAAVTLLAEFGVDHTTKLEQTVANLTAFNARAEAVLAEPPLA